MNRFRGALLGTALGEGLGVHSWMRLQTSSPRSWSDVDRWGFGKLTVPLPVAMGTVVTEQINLLIQGERASQPATMSLFKAHGNVPSAGHCAASAKAAIAAIPIALALHDDIHQLHRTLEEAIIVWQAPAESKVGALLVCRLLALILREQFIPEGFERFLAESLGSEPISLVWATQLHQLNHLLQTKAGLVTAVAQLTQPRRISASEDAAMLETTPILLALYSFLSTPGDFRLTLLRAAQASHQPQLTCAIAGLLSGSYNGITAIPVHWRQTFCHQSVDALLVKMWEIESETALITLADRLWSVWAGVHTPTHPTEVLRYSAAIAAPNIIRPR
ncbi:ADP-ribosylglycohydrolase family protein [Oculatella sp. LEGE 06141]|uniref:ADP-ribosylglycohydrolase family protein n=1 Tax=Oculatella sp. LEGE 06141 TaxID=1828648 RepID=UPI001880C0F1|nr:ADP-ribosylglycohydrolase family protein [Oculatella sp. LEGE 06141]